MPAGRVPALKTRRPRAQPARTRQEKMYAAPLVRENNSSREAGARRAGACHVVVRIVARKTLVPNFLLVAYADVLTTALAAGGVARVAKRAALAGPALLVVFHRLFMHSDDE